MFSKGTTIASRAGLEIKGNKKRNGRTREEHIKIMCKHNGRKSKKEEVFKKLKDLEKTKDVKNMSLRELEVAIGVSKSTLARHIKEYYAI